MDKGMRVTMYALLLLLCAAALRAENGGAVQILRRPRSVRCTLRQYPRCYLVLAQCPSACPTSCLMDCTLCRPVCNCFRRGAVCQDPRFVGGDGVTFYFHGKRDRDFCLVTDPGVHINAHFIGKRGAGMARDFTWVQSLAVLFGGSADTHHGLFVAAEPTAAWDDAVDRLAIALDGIPVTLPPSEGASWTSPAQQNLSVTRTREANGVSVELRGKFAISVEVVPITEEESRVHRYNITADNCFAHLDLGFKFYDLTEEVDGVLGRTYRKNYTSRAKVGAAMPVLGGDREFTASGLFAADCAVSRFRAGASAGKEYADMQCKSGPEGRGVLLCTR